MASIAVLPTWHCPERHFSEMQPFERQWSVALIVEKPATSGLRAKLPDVLPQQGSEGVDVWYEGSD
ncbi:hypothetical protein [Photobacterium sp. GSS17]|uniref:hypothetical protein n=1 Tax=Photobacterium sp. GSS17 TaxID=3020715 RepID=UPI00235F48DB|nr:hypothetical protein [Photobacterium sp. GSS17]